jgi:hypothetical protein
LYFIISLNALQEGLDISVGIATDYGLDGSDYIFQAVARFFSPQHPERLRGPPSFYSVGEHFLGGKAAGA